MKKIIAIGFLLTLSNCVSMTSKAVPAATFDSKEIAKQLAKDKSGFYAQSQLLAKREFLGTKFQKDEQGKCYIGIGIERCSLGSGNNIMLTVCPAGNDNYSLQVSQDVNGVFKVLSGENPIVSIALSADKKYIRVNWDGETVETNQYASPKPFAGFAFGQIDL